MLSCQLCVILFMWKRKTVWPHPQTLANPNTRTDALMIKEMIKRGNFSPQPNFFHFSASTFVLRTMFPNTWVCVSACSYICVCVLHACMRFKERGIECKREREIGDRMGDDGLDLITGLEWLEGFVVPHFLNRTFLSAGRGRIHNSRQASARGTQC